MTEITDRLVRLRGEKWHSLTLTHVQAESNWTRHLYTCLHFIVKSILDAVIHSSILPRNDRFPAVLGQLLVTQFVACSLQAFEVSMGRNEIGWGPHRQLYGFTIEFLQILEHLGYQFSVKMTSALQCDAGMLDPAHKLLPAVPSCSLEPPVLHTKGTHSE